MIQFGFDVSDFRIDFNQEMLDLTEFLRFLVGDLFVFHQFDIPGQDFA
jgi:hypothetical protein